MFSNGPSRRSVLAVVVAVFLLGVFISVNYWRSYRDSHQIPDPSAGGEHEQLPAGLEGNGKRLAFHDFEWGSANGTVTNLAISGHSGKQSLRMSQKLSFSPGIWIKFKDIKPYDSLWIRATGYVWFSCAPGELKCYLVATCNHNGVNYKYMFTDLETANLKPDQWNRVAIDYRIPQPVNREDVLQAYFWYRGVGEMLVDDVEVKVYAAGREKGSW